MFVSAFAPMMPHLAEECWEALGRGTLVSESSWPEIDRSLIVSEKITMPVQVNGRKRGDVTVARDADAKLVEAAALALDAVRKAMDNKPPKKVIIVPQRIVNVVV
jgi:leucyl-tRNA synthetase